MGWIQRNRHRIEIALLLLAVSYPAAGVEGVAAQAAFITVLIAVSDLGPKFRDIFGSDDDEGPPDRVTFVRIQEEVPIEVELDIGGMIRGTGWEEVEVERYDTHPGGAIEKAKVEYEWWKITHYAERKSPRHLGVDGPSEDIDEGEWVPAVP